MAGQHQQVQLPSYFDHQQHQTVSTMQQQQMNSMQQQAQANFMAAAHHQQMHHQIRSATPPGSSVSGGVVIQQRQQTFSHPGMMQHMRAHSSASPQNHPSPQQQQQQYQAQQQQRQLVVRQLQQPGSVGPSQQPPNQFTHFIRQQGVSQLVHVTSSSPNLQMQHPQQMHPQQFRPHQQPQQNSMGPIRYGSTGLVQQQQQGASSSPAGGKLSPQQELHVLQQHFPSTQMTPTAAVAFAQQQRHQQQQQAAAVAQQQQYHQHQQMQQHLSNQTPQQHHIVRHQLQQQPQQQMIVMQQPMGMLSSQPPSMQQQPQEVQERIVYMTNQPSQQQFAGSGGPTNPMGSPPQTVHQFVIKQQQQMRSNSNGPNGDYGQGQQPINDQFQKQRLTPVIQQQQSSPGMISMDQQQQEDNDSPSITDRATPATTSKNNGVGVVKKVASSTIKAKGGKTATAPKASPNPTPADLVRASAAGAPAGRLVERDALEAFVKTTDPNAVLEDEVADAMHLLLDDFVDELIRNSVEMSKHRGANRLEARDVRFALAHRIKMAVPSESVLGGTVLTAGNSANAGVGGPPPAKRSAGLIAHQQRMALIDKNLKKL